MQEYIDYIIELVKSQMNSNQFLTGGLILGAITTAVYSLKGIPIYIWNRIERRIKFEVTIEQNDDLYPWLQNWLNIHYASQLRAVKASFWRVNTSKIMENGSSYGHGRKTFVKENEVVFNHHGDSFTILYNGRFIRIRSHKEKLEHASSWDNIFFEKFYLDGIFAKNSIRKLLEEVAAFNIEQEKRKIVPLIKYNSYDNWETDHNTVLREIDSIFIETAIKQSLIDDITSFAENKEFYQKRNIPYRRGYLLEGPPGTGKSSLVSAIASYFKKDIYILNIRAVGSDAVFSRLLSYISRGSILLIEDIDGYFDGRKSAEKVNFSTFLNEISGVKCKHDILLFVTTNHKEKLDEALIRPGRLDLHLTIGLPTAKAVNAYLSWFFETELENHISDPILYTMAEVENACVQNKFNPRQAIAQLQNQKQHDAVIGCLSDDPWKFRE